MEVLRTQRLKWVFRPKNSISIMVMVILLISSYNIDPIWSKDLRKLSEHKAPVSKKKYHPKKNVDEGEKFHGHTAPRSDMDNKLDFGSQEPDKKSSTSD